MTTSASNRDAAFIQATYEQLAQLGDSRLCCSPLDLYSPEELTSLPDDVLRLSSGCGHPVDDATIEPGSTVLDIGSGAGADCLLAAQRVGPTGTVIGVDPSPSMRTLAATHRDRLGLPWIDYRDGTADALPCPDNSVDLVISNCVLALSTDPVATWTEIGRVLVPGGQAVVSDIVGGSTDGVQAQARCETGVEWPTYRAVLHTAGFSGVRPVRVRQTRFRDGATACSVTFHARHAMPTGHASIDVLYRQSHRPTADHLARALGAASKAAHLPVSIRLIDVESPTHAACANLLFTASDIAHPPPVSISVDAAITTHDIHHIDAAAHETITTLTTSSRSARFGT